MSELESELNESISMANANHRCHPGGDGYILMRRSEARSLVERLCRYETAAQTRAKTEVDQRIDNLRAAMPYIAAAVCGIIGLVIGQVM